MCECVTQDKMVCFRKKERGERESECPRDRACKFEREYVLVPLKGKLETFEKEAGNERGICE